mmetsp:Transcript_28631/g.80640  ORF Transcript_28631/g.80640 Transcript_28631/m.80640 type:complete len:273 (+) Transcript_28631:431-1249(+)
MSCKVVDLVPCASCCGLSPSALGPGLIPLDAALCRSCLKAARLAYGWPVSGSRYLAGSPVMVHLGCIGELRAFCRMYEGSFIFNKVNVTLDSSLSRKLRYLMRGPGYFCFVARALAFVASSRAIIFSRLAMLSISVRAASARSSSWVSVFSSTFGFFFNLFSLSKRSFSFSSCSRYASAVRCFVDCRSIRGAGPAAVTAVLVCTLAPVEVDLGTTGGFAVPPGCRRTGFFVPGGFRAGRLRSALTSTSPSSSLSSLSLKSLSTTSSSSLSLW